VAVFAVGWLLYVGYTVGMALYVCRNCHSGDTSVGRKWCSSGGDDAYVMFGWVVLQNSGGDCNSCVGDGDGDGDVDGIGYIYSGES